VCAFILFVLSRCDIKTYNIVLKLIFKLSLYFASSWISFIDLFVKSFMLVDLETCTIKRLLPSWIQTFKDKEKDNNSPLILYTKQSKTIIHYVKLTQEKRRRVWRRSFFSPSLLFGLHLTLQLIKVLPVWWPCLAATMSSNPNLMPQILLSCQIVPLKCGIYVSSHAHHFPWWRINAPFSFFFKRVQPIPHYQGLFWATLLSTDFAAYYSHRIPPIWFGNKQHFP